MNKRMGLILGLIGAGWFAGCAAVGISMLDSFFHSSPRQAASLFPLFILGWVAALLVGQYAIYWLASILMKTWTKVGPALNLMAGTSITLAGDNLEIRLLEQYASNSSGTLVIPGNAETKLLLPEEEMPAPQYSQVIERVEYRAAA